MGAGNRLRNKCMKLTAATYATMLRQAWAKTSVAEHPIVLKTFIKLLVRRRALKLAPRILAQLQRQLDHAAGVQRVTVWSAGKIDQAEFLKEVTAVLGAVVIDQHHDPSLKAGLKIRIGDTLIDSSLAARLDILHTHLMTS